MSKRPASVQGVPGQSEVHRETEKLQTMAAWLRILQISEVYCMSGGFPRCAMILTRKEILYTFRPPLLSVSGLLHASA